MIAALPHAWSILKSLTMSGKRILAEVRLTEVALALPLPPGVASVNGSVEKLVPCVVILRGCSSEMVLVMPFPQVAVYAATSQPPSPVSLDGMPQNEVMGEE